MGQEKHVFSIDWAGRKLTVETGQLAKQANGAVMVRYGDTAVLSTATASKEPKTVDFFPLTVNYEERLYAVGKIPGGFIKREGRPSEKAILASRLIDRPIRPLFADGFRNEVQVVSIVMSVDQDCSSEMAAMFGSSLALSVSDIPFEGPIAGVTVGRVDNEFIINPTLEQLEKSDIHLVVAGTKDAINMVEAGADEVPEEIMLEAIMFGHEEIKRLIAFQEEIVAAVGKEKSEITLYEIDSDLKEKVRGLAESNLLKAIQVHEKHAREDAISEVKNEVLAKFEEEEHDEDTLKQVKDILSQLVKNEVRRLITEEKFVLTAGQSMRSARFLQKSDSFREHTVQAFSHGGRRRRSAFVRSVRLAMYKFWTVSVSRNQNALCTITTSRSSASGKQGRCADRDAAKSGTEPSGNVRLSRLFRLKKTSRTPSASSLKCLNQTVQLPRRAFVQARLL